MGSIGRFLTAFVLMAALLLGAVGGASAHALMAGLPGDGTAHQDEACAGHDDHRAAPNNAPDPDHQHHAMPMAAPCCPTLGAPSRIEVTRTALAPRRVVWHPAAKDGLAARPITPEPPPPKSAR